MKINFAEVQNASEYEPVPDGSYVVEIEDVEETATKNGDDMFRLKHRVIEGDQKGRCVFDNVPLTQAAWPRLKLILESVGVEVSGEVDVVPSLLVGRRCRVEVRTTSFVDKKGKEAKRNEVPFRGYSHADGDLNPENYPS
jgi:hypothetical protein